MNFDQKLNLLHNLPRSQVNVTRVGRAWLSALDKTTDELDAIEIKTRASTMRELVYLRLTPEEIEDAVLPYITAFIERWREKYNIPQEKIISVESVREAIIASIMDGGGDKKNKLQDIVVSKIVNKMIAKPNLAL